MSLIGYARVSTRSQHTDGQAARLREAGCGRVFIDLGITGTKASRPDWDRCLAALRPGDVLMVVKLDRIGRSLVNLVDVVKVLGERGIGIKSLDQGEIDTTTANGTMLFGILAVLAQWESDMASERTVEGLDAARERHGGKLPVRGPSVSPDQVAIAQELFDRHEMPAHRIAAAIGCSRSTLYRHIVTEPEGAL
jgi:DNA invertase Pin-like site-specific DNA recombinase